MSAESNIAGDDKIGGFRYVRTVHPGATSIVLEVVQELAKTLKSGALVLDCSTVGAETSRKAAELLKPRGSEFLDCPVSGGVEGARDGTLAIMCGGSPAAFTRAQPVLSAMGRTVSHFGPVGAGQAAEIRNHAAKTVRIVAARRHLLDIHGYDIALLRAFDHDRSVLRIEKRHLQDL